jgi:hypothetical protein
MTTSEFYIILTLKPSFLHNYAALYIRSWRKYMRNGTAAWLSQQFAYPAKAMDATVTLNWHGTQNSIIIIICRISVSVTDVIPYTEIKTEEKTIHGNTYWQLFKSLTDSKQNSYVQTRRRSHNEPHDCIAYSTGHILTADQVQFCNLLLFPPMTKLNLKACRTWPSVAAHPTKMHRNVEHLRI